MEGTEKYAPGCCSGPCSAQEWPLGVAPYGLCCLGTGNAGHTSTMNQTLVRPAHPSLLLTFSYIADFWE